MPSPPIKFVFVHLCVYIGNLIDRLDAATKKGTIQEDAVCSVKRQIGFSGAAIPVPEIILPKPEIGTAT